MVGGRCKVPIWSDYDMGGQKISHAYIIASPSESERTDSALRLGAAMVCSGQGNKPCKACKDCRKVYSGIHPDLIFLDKQSDDKSGKPREIYVDQIRSIVSDAYILPNEAGKKVYIIKDADTMNAGAQNALLKLLEEPPEHVGIILCVGNAGLLLDTIRSRCVELNVNGMEETPGEDYIVFSKEYLSLAASGDRAGLLRFCFEREKMDALQVIGFAECTKLILTDMLGARAPDMGMDRKRMVAIVGLMNKTLDYLRFNVGVKHVFGMIAVRTL
jgi:hypothetical protein